MKKIINMFFYLLKFILLIIAFVSTLYIIVYMYQRLNKSLSESVQVFLPYAVLFILFCVNLVVRQRGVTGNIFYNITCCLVFATLCYCGYRAIFDTNMLMNDKMGYGINFNYYSDIISPMKIMLYGLSIGNVCLMFDNSKKQPKVIVEKEEEKKVPKAVKRRISK